MKKLYLSLLLLMAGLVSFAQRTIRTRVSINKPIANYYMTIGSYVDVDYTITNLGPDTIKASDTIMLRDSRHVIGKVTPFFYTVDIPPGSSIQLNSTVLGATWKVLYDTLYMSSYTGAKVSVLLDREDAKIEFPTMRKIYTPRFKDSSRYAWYVEITDIKSQGKINAITYASSGMGNSMDTAHIWTDGWPLSVLDVFSVSTEQIKVFPNPASSQISFEHNFTSGENAALYVVDLLGRVVKQQSLNKGSYYGLQQVTVDLNDVSAGTYFLRLQSGDKVQSAKFLINK
ncbi:T9SS type A sorting domain-containing protein [Rurimicrobium arvi]